MSSEGDGSFSETYRVYKISTEYFLNWLWCQYRLLVPNDASIYSPNSTKDMLNAAKVLKKAKSVVPASIIASLRTAIAKRREAATIYKNLGADDINHDVFIQRLENTLSILTPLMTQSKASPSKTSGTNRPTTTNSFESLASLTEDLQAGLSLSATSAQTVLPPPIAEPEETQTSASKMRAPDTSLEDDELGQRLQMALILKDMETMKSQLRQYWTAAAKGTLPLPVASWLTSLVFWQVKELFTACFRGSSHEFGQEWRRAHAFFSKHPKVLAQFGVSDLSGAVRFSTLSKAVNNYEALSEGIEEMRKMFSIFMIPKDQEDLIPRREPPTELPDLDDTEATEHWIVMEVFKSIKKVVKEKRAISVLENVSCLDATEPCEPILTLALDSLRNTNLPAPMNLVLGMDLFLTSYEAFLWPDGVLNKENCRVKSLRLALEVQAGIRPAMEALKKLAHDVSFYAEIIKFVQELHDAMGAYLREKKFDIYHRAPWTAGGHMTEILHKAGLAGNLLCFEQHIVPSVLHLYNALRRSSFDLRPIPLMEELCDLGTDNVFLGSRPNRNFLSHYRRAVFGFKTGKDASQDGESQLRRVISGAKSRVKRIDPLFAFQHYNEYIFSFSFMARVFGERAEEPFTHTEMENLRKLHMQRSARAFIDQAKDAVLAEFRGPYPIARINFFAIFGLCASILERFSKLAAMQHYPGLQFHSNYENHIMKGAAMVDPLLALIVKFSRNEKDRRLLPALTLGIIAAWALQDSVDQDAKLSQFCYDV